MHDSPQVTELPLNVTNGVFFSWVGAVEVLRFENETPNKKLFQFRQISDRLLRAGRYMLEFELKPHLPGGQPLQHRVPIIVEPGPPVKMSTKVRAVSTACTALGPGCGDFIIEVCITHIGFAASCQSPRLAC